LTEIMAECRALPFFQVLDCRHKENADNPPPIVADIL